MKKMLFAAMLLAGLAFNQNAFAAQDDEFGLDAVNQEQVQPTFDGVTSTFGTARQDIDSYMTEMRKSIAQTREAKDVTKLNKQNEKSVQMGVLARTLLESAAQLNDSSDTVELQRLLALVQMLKSKADILMTEFRMIGSEQEQEFTTGDQVTDFSQDNFEDIESAGGPENQNFGNNIAFPPITENPNQNSSN
ncbi:MAG: hypothetical protein WAX89_00005 [Alphaproteobacteria bacterium]